MLGPRIDRFIARRVPVKPYFLKPSKPIVSFTFDDFPQSAFVEGSKILERSNVAGTFYGCASLSGKTFEGLRQSDMENIERLLAAGHELGCHTNKHLNCQSISVAEFAEDCSDNAEAYSDALGERKLLNFAYPYGCVDIRSKRFVGRNFATGRGVRAGLNVGLSDLSELRANSLYEKNMDDANVNSMIQRAVDRCAWLVFYTHDIDEAPSPYGCSPKTLEKAVKTALDAGCSVLPIRHALAEAVYGTR